MADEKAGGVEAEGESAASRHLEGWLTKRGSRIKTWKRRWFTLDGTHIEYFTEPNGKKKGELEIFGASVEPVGKKSVKFEHCVEITTPVRTLYIVAETAEDMQRWLSVMRLVAKASTRRGSVRTAPEMASGGVDEDDSSLSPLPNLLVVTGRPETHSTLTLRAKPAILDDLCISWFATTASVGNGRDATAIDAKEFIAGGNQETLVLTDDHAGMTVGAMVKAAGGKSCIVAIAPRKVKAVDTSTVAVSIYLVPHKHSKYCDRKYNVCTAPGKFREAEVLRAKVTGPADKIKKYRIRWHRSKLTADTDPSIPRSPKPSGADGAGGEVSESGEATRSEAKEELEGFDQGLEFEEVKPKPLNWLPPLPLPSAPSVRPVPTSELPRSPPPPRTGAVAYPLLLADVGRVIKVDLVPISDADGLPVVEGVTAGPIEPGPPRARELWVNGEPQVGRPLFTETYYFGGYEGASEYWWLRISPDGDRTDISEPAPIPLGVKAPVEGDAADTWKSDPRVYVPTKEDEGCRLKVKCRALRVDGTVQGYPSTSKPTKAIAAAAPSTDAADAGAPPLPAASTTGGGETAAETTAEGTGDDAINAEASTAAAESASEAAYGGPWSEQTDEDGNTYFYNADTEESSWEKPAEMP